MALTLSPILPGTLLKWTAGDTTAPLTVASRNDYRGFWARQPKEERLLNLPARGLLYEAVHVSINTSVKLTYTNYLSWLLLIKTHRFLLLAYFLFRNCWQSNGSNTASCRLHVQGSDSMGCRAVSAKGSVPCRIRCGDVTSAMSLNVGVRAPGCFEEIAKK